MTTVRDLKVPTIIDISSKVSPYKPTEEDYLKEIIFSDASKAALYSLRGRTTLQKSFLSAQEIKDFEKLDGNEINGILTQTCNIMQEKYGQENTAGSSLHATIAWRSDHPTSELNIVSANIGNSATFLVILPKEGGIQYRAVNQLHQKSLMLQNSLHRKTIPVDRAIGAKEFEFSDLKHQPDILHKKVVLNRGDRAFLLTTTAGLTREGILDEKHIGNIILRNKDKAITSIAEALATEHLTSFIDADAAPIISKDNVVIAVREVTRPTPVLLGAFEGYGNSNKVSRRLMAAFGYDVKIRTELWLKVKHCKALFAAEIGETKGEVDVVDVFHQRFIKPLAHNVNQVLNARLTWIPNFYRWCLEKIGWRKPELRICWLTQRNDYRRVQLYKQYRLAVTQLEKLNEVPKKSPAKSSHVALPKPVLTRVNTPIPIYVRSNPFLGPMDEEEFSITSPIHGRGLAKRG